MKKVISSLLALSFSAVALIGGVACNNQEENSGDLTVKIYMPDGAPALAMAKFMSENKGDCDFNVVEASTIVTYVTGESPQADLCVLPLNAASKLLGTGETYTMLGTVTHGNLYLLSTNNETILETGSDLSKLAGKKIGTIQINNVPGLTLKMLLEKNGVDYKEGENKAELIPIAKPADISPALGYDYYLAAEPLASTKVKMTANTPSPFHIVGDLQKLYGGENGYPQAVLVAKNTFVEENTTWVNSFVEEMEGVANWLNAETTEVSTIVNAVSKNLTAGLTPSLNATNLTKDVVKNCGVWFTGAQEGKQEVNDFLQSLIEVDSAFAKPVADKFFYQGK